MAEIREMLNNGIKVGLIDKLMEDGVIHLWDMLGELGELAS